MFLRARSWKLCIWLSTFKDEFRKIYMAELLFNLTLEQNC